MTADPLAYPGEFEVLRTKAEAGLWDSGNLTVTNYRVMWAPSRFAKTPAFAAQRRSVFTVFLR